MTHSGTHAPRHAVHGIVTRWVSGRVMTTCGSLVTTPGGWAGWLRRSASLADSVSPTFPIMCGRYASFLPTEAIRRTFRTVNPLPNLEPSWNVAPTQMAPVVRRHPETGERHLDLLQWGLLPHFTKDPERARRPINARAETVTTSAMFRGAFAQRRCILPAEVFYEWRVAPAASRPSSPFGVLDTVLKTGRSQPAGVGSTGSAVSGDHS